MRSFFLQFRENVLKQPSHTAIIDNDKVYTYLDLFKIIENTNGYLKDDSFQKGEKAVILLPNSKEFIFLLLSLLDIQVVVIPVNYNSCHFEFVKIITQFQPDYIFTEREKLKDFNFLNSIENNIDIYIIKRDCEKFELKSNIKFKEISFDKFGDSLPTSLTHNEVLHDINAQAAIHLCYTGYGELLGAVHTLQTYTFGAKFLCEFSSGTKEDTFLSAIPFYHIFSFIANIFAPLYAGAAITLLPDFSIRKILTMIEKNHITVLNIIPVILKLMAKFYRREKHNLASIRVCNVGGSYINENEMKELIRVLGINICQGYGLTEALITHINPVFDNRYGSIGKPVSSKIKTKIIDEIGNEVLCNSVGEIILKSPTLIAGYYRNKKMTGLKLKNTWFYTGDLGYISKDNYLYFTGRKKRITKVRSQIVDLLEIEEAVKRLESIESVEAIS